MKKVNGMDKETRNGSTLPEIQKVKREKVKKESAKRETVKVEKVKKRKQKRKRAKFSIAFQILMCFFIPVLFVIIVGVQAYQSAAEGLSRKFQEASSETLQMTTEYVELGCEFISVEALQYAFNDNLGKYYLGLYKNDPIELMNAMNEANDMISTTKLANSFVNDIHIITKSGINLISTSTGTTTKDRNGFYEEMKKELQGIYPNGRIPNWLDSHTLMDEKLLLNPEDIMMSYLVQSNGNNAFIVVDLKKKKIQEVLDGLDFGDGSIVAMITQNGNTCISGTEEKINFLELNCYIEGAESQEIEGVIETRINEEGYQYLYHKAKNGSFTICALVPDSTITAQADSIKSVTVIMVAIASVAAILIGILLSFRMSKSMKRVMKSMSAVSGGDLTVKIKDKGMDEFSLLSHSMNSMVSNTKALVKKVSGATKRMEDSTHAVTKAAEVINEYSENITGAIGEIHAGMNVQSENAQECLSKTDSLSEEIQLIHGRIEDIGKLTVATGKKINDSMRVMGALGERAVVTSEMTNKVEASITMLQEEFKQIKGFVETINSISDETNLLSLNASIEAAGAGEAGRGFAVVADQIRKLADGSAKAAAEIQKTVDGITVQTAVSVDNAKQAKEMVELQTQAVEEVQVSFRGMQKDMEQVVQRMQGISQNAEKADSEREAALQAIHNISAVIEETASASAIVNETAEKLLSHATALRTTAVILDENMDGLNADIHMFKTE